jgi:hypothetical protein
MFLETGVTSSVIQAAGRARRRDQRLSEGAGGAGEHEAANAGGHRLLEQVERAGHVRVHEVLLPMRADVRLVQRGGVHDRVHAVHAAPHAFAVDHGAHHGRERRIDQVEPHDIHALGVEHPNQGLAEMARAAGDQHPHV